MKKITTLILCTSMLFSFNILAKSYGERICSQPEFDCYKVKRGETWYSLFPDQRDRDLIKRLNRMNIPIRAGNLIAIPKNIARTNLTDISPFPNKLPSSGVNFIQVNQAELAWGAYDENGNLLKWGPMSGGKNYCPDVGRGCKTISGTFTLIRKKGENCKSGKYPRPNGGAPMPYCMFFHGGYALHGSNTVPGRHASHGCVRLFTEDARWLNLNFIRLGITKVIISR